MKNIFLLSVAICSSQFVMAGEDIDGANQNYAIISDEFSADVAVGKCLVVGLITEIEYNALSGPVRIPMVGGQVSTLDRKKLATSNGEGNYSLLVDAKDTSIFFYKAGNEEIVIWKYLFKSQHKVTINFYPGMNRSMMIVDKPVIYLYSDSEINAEIQFSCKGDLTFTYPEYNEKWEVAVNKNKITENKSGKTYPYLFWEAETNDLDFVIESNPDIFWENENNDMEFPPDFNSIKGFLIKTDTVVNFLENTLTALGLNSTEQTDFITFWAPKIIQKPYALFQFLVDDLYAEKISEMKITPTPDAIRRVFMLFKPLDSEQTGIEIISPELNSFERKAFTVVEWGGSEISQTLLIP